MPSHEAVSALQARLLAINNAGDTSDESTRCLGMNKVPAQPDPLNSASIGLRLSSLGREASLLSQMLDAVRNERSRLETLQRLLVNEERTIYKIPPEIITMIFEAGNPQSVSGTRAFAHTVSTTCHRWRRIAHHIPALWRHIRLQYASTFEVTSQEEFDSYIQRSKPFTLDMEISFRGQGRNFYDDANDRIMAMARPHFPRCHRLQIVAENPAIFFNIIPLQGVFPALTHFRLQYNADLKYTASLYHNAAPFVNPTPQLKFLELQGFLPSFERFNAQSITHISLNWTCPDKAVQLLAQCPSLKVLRWEGYCDDAEPDADYEELRYSSLITLDLNCLAPLEVSLNITAPTLQHLLLTMDGTRTSESRDSVEEDEYRQMIARGLTFPALRSIGIKADTAPWEHPILEQFICAHSHLEIIMADCLGLQHPDGPGALLRMLSVHSPEADASIGTLLCPKVRVVVLLNYNPSANKEAPVASVARTCLETRTRCGNVPFQIRITSTAPDEDLQAINDIAADYPRGLVVTRKAGVTLQECASSWPANSISSVLKFERLMWILGDEIP